MSPPVFRCACACPCVMPVEAEGDVCDFCGDGQHGVSLDRLRAGGDDV